MNLAEEFVLLAYDDDGTPVTDGTRLDTGLGGALLLELALAGRVDDALALIAADEKGRRPGHWVSKFAKQTRPLVLDGLVRAGVLTTAKDRVLGLFPRTRYPATGGVEPPAESEARRRMWAAVGGDGEVDTRTGALCALVAATELDGKVFAGIDRKVVKARLKQIGEGAWAADAVKQAIADVQAAVMTAVIASTTAATTIST